MDLFTRLESQYGLPSGLLDAVWAAESSRGRNMLSPKGASGHMGFMPATAQQYGVQDPHDLAQAATGAARMYSDLLRQSGGDLPRALAGYNWGVGNLARKGFDAAPTETRNYIQKVTAAMGQPQAAADAGGDEWSALARQFAPTNNAKPKAEPDPWAELGKQFAQPVAPVTAPPQQEKPSDRSQPGEADVARTMSAAKTALIPLVGPALAAAGIEVDAPAVAKGLLSGFADVGNTIINSGTKAGADTWAGIDDRLGLLPERVKRPRAGITNLVTGRVPMSQAERENVDRAAALKDFNRENASPWFTGGRIAGNVAATYPVGGALAAPVRAVPALAPLAESLASGGFRTALAPTSLLGRTGNMVLRSAGGAATGGASAGLVTPGDASLGAAIGAALPPSVRFVGQGAGALTSAARRYFTPQAARDARTVIEASGLAQADVPALRAALSQQGPNIVQAPETVPQILQNQGVSQLSRTLHNAGSKSVSQARQLQSEAQMEALNRVSPVAPTVHEAAESFGNTAGPQIRAADEAARQQVEQAFGRVDPLDETRFVLPIEAMDDATGRFLGRGTFGPRAGADAARRTARDIGQEVRHVEDAAGNLVEETVARPVPFREVQNLRSSIGDAHAEAQARGRSREAAALDQMRREIDQRVEVVANGQGSMEESFPPDVVDRWRDAIRLHATRMQTYRTGPAASLFHQGRDGLPAAQGAELAGKFFSARPSQSDDIAAFRRLATPDTTELLKNYAITQAASNTDALGRLTNAKFNTWLSARSGGVDGLFDEGERATLSGVGKSLAKADNAERLGLATGSNTSQNQQSALSLGLLDSPIVNGIASRTPLIGRFTGPMLDALRQSARASKVDRLGGLLADPQALEQALAAYERSQARSVPFLLGDSAITSGLLRAAPVLAGDL